MSPTSDQGEGPETVPSSGGRRLAGCAAGSGQAARPTIPALGKPSTGARMQSLQSA